MSVVEIDIDKLYALFPEPWSKRLSALSFSESKLSELKPRFEENWYLQCSQSLNLKDEHIRALIDLADLIWKEDSLRRMALISRHFLFNASELELEQFTWSTDFLADAGIKDSGLFYLLAYISGFDAAIGVYREQRIALDLFTSTAQALNDYIELQDNGFTYTNNRLLALLCEGKLIALGGVVFLPSKWEELNTIWRNGLNGDLEEKLLPDTISLDLQAILNHGREEGMDLNTWQLKLKPTDKILLVLGASESLTQSDIKHALGQADRFYKDSDHFYNFTAFDCRQVPLVKEALGVSLVLREEL